jgi:hypothetical protein
MSLGSISTDSYSQKVDGHVGASLVACYARVVQQPSPAVLLPPGVCLLERGGELPLFVSVFLALSYDPTTCTPPAYFFPRLKDDHNHTCRLLSTFQTIA